MDPAIAHLQRHSAFESLEIDQSGFGLDADRFARTQDHEIPRTQVSGDRESDLGPDRQRRRKVFPEALDQRQVRLVAKG
jgi:hypothetical protein